MNEENRWDRQAVRGITLLEGEEPLVALHGRDGLASGPPPDDGFLLLTNRRVMGFSRDGGRERMSIASLEDIQSVEVASPSRDTGALFTGGMLVLAGLVAGILVDAFGFNLLVALTVAAAIVGLGVISASKYFVADGMAMVVFRAGAAETGLQLQNERAVQDAYALVSLFFQLKAGEGLPLPGAEVATRHAEDRSSAWQEASMVEGGAGESAGPSPIPGQEDQETLLHDWRDPESP